MASGRALRAAGFTLPLTLALAFSLMTLATAIVGMVVVSDRQAKAAAIEVTDRITLESAIEAGLVGLARNGEPQAPDWAGRQSFNGRDVKLLFASPRYKPDFSQDPPSDAGAVLADADLRQRVLAALAPTADGTPPGYSRFTQLVAHAAATPAEEDCLRQRMTIGRVEAQRVKSPPATALIPPNDPLTTGELIEVRAEMDNGHGGRDVLWRRVRYSGDPARAWLTHDWRLLRLGRDDADCEVVAPAASFSDFTLGP